MFQVRRRSGWASTFEPARFSTSACRVPNPPCSLRRGAPRLDLPGPIERVPPIPKIPFEGSHGSCIPCTVPSRAMRQDRISGLGSLPSAPEERDAVARGYGFPMAPWRASMSRSRVSPMSRTPRRISSATSSRARARAGFLATSSASTIPGAPSGSTSPRSGSGTTPGGEPELWAFEQVRESAAKPGDGHVSIENLTGLLISAKGATVDEPLDVTSFRECRHSRLLVGVRAWTRSGTRQAGPRSAKNRALTGPWPASSGQPR